ncbi:MAG: hypothetical protein Q8M08_03090 [Bacteroidales bacterium]|nr:hypothetical protein [Bacteroidales bacterium]
MKKIQPTYSLLLIVLILLCPGLKAQTPFDHADRERIQVCTDRTMYVSGEKVFFSALIYHTGDLSSEQLSRVFYCELITPGGNKIAGRKYLLQNSSGQGWITIPEETVSGVYFLKFYTRFMRNISTDKYKYIMLKIINPYKMEVLPGNDVTETTFQPIDSNEAQTVDHTLNIISGKTDFPPRETVQINVKVPTGEISSGKLCLSVIPESTYNTPVFKEMKANKERISGSYLPETRGVSLSGQLIGKETGKPIPLARVNLSIIGDKDIMVVRTDSSGKFFFALPDHHEKKDLFLCADDVPDITPEILIDNDFCSRRADLPSPMFLLGENEMKAAYKLAVNFRVMSIFREEAFVKDSTEQENITSFYGKPTETLVMDKYIDLPTLEEYFTQLPSVVMLRKIQGRKQFRFYTVQSEMSMYDPLLLVDWVAVNDIERILAMSPFDVERIELVNAAYVKGNITYGGIISFVSKKNDFAGIDLPTSGTFVNYRFLEDCSDTALPVAAQANIPDARNTVYWNPAIQTNEEGAASISFTAPDTPGKYYILLRGMRPTGGIILTEKMFVVKDE